MIPLTNELIQSLVSDEVFERGETYYRENRVEKFTYDGKVYRSVVSGTNDYHVKVCFSSKGWDARCDCPYDWEDFCKHIVAVMIKIVEIQKNKTSQNQKIDNQITTREIKLLSEYKSLVRSTIHGFVEWDKTYQALQGTYHVENIASRLLSQKKFKEAATAYQAIFEVLIVKILQADDSGGSFGEAIAEAFIGWVEAVFSLSSFYDKKPFFDYALAQGEDDNWSCNGFDDELINHIVEKAFDQKDCQYILSSLDKIYGEDYRPRSDFDSGFDFYLSCKARLLQKIGKQKNYELFSLKYLNNHKVLFPYLNYLINKGRLNETLKIGELHLDKIIPGYRPQLMEILLPVYTKLQLKEKQKEILMFLYVERFDEIYYERLKELCKEDGDWNYWRNKIIEKFSNSSQEHRIADVFIKENMTQELINLASQAEEEYILEPTADYLSKKQPKQAFNTYEKLVKGYLDKYVGRKYYLQAARWMRRMKKLGFDDNFIAFVTKIREKYKKRSALLEEIINL